MLIVHGLLWRRDLNLMLGCAIKKIIFSCHLSQKTLWQNYLHETVGDNVSFSVLETTIFFVANSCIEWKKITFSLTFSEIYVNELKNSFRLIATFLLRCNAVDEQRSTKVMNVRTMYSITKVAIHDTLIYPSLFLCCCFYGIRFETHIWRYADKREHRSWCAEK